ncbi:beta-lactamase [Enterococcus canis]|uniref:Beta-lactamase n=1 Tax=Enterococcus canis TaxID=214095 RepID=A0A1L8RB20_9ENTE|nr:serine hydrolase domain-containing protein [Enterococcus canis]OJG16969.1 beta-lactamase [Enterococcus canis]
MTVLENEKKENEFSGIILKRENQQIQIEMYGYRDKSNQLAIHTDTKFGTASMGKIFVAVAIMKLIEQKKLSLETTLDNFYGTSLKEINGDITIYELLTHTSGIQDYFDESIEADYEQLWQKIPNYSIRKNSDIMPLFVDKKQDSKRRGEFIYNNAGYVLLADIIEKITNCHFDQVLKDMVFDKLHMSNTGYFELDNLPANTAIGYIKEQGEKPRSNIYSIDCKGTGAGGCYTTVMDICNFWDGLFSYEILSEKSISEMIKKHVGNEKEHYGLGIWLANSTKNHTHIYIEGCDPGVSCISLFNPLEKDIYTVFSNYEDNVWELARNYLAGKKNNV